MTAVFLRALHDRRRALTWWVLGLLALNLFTVIFYPTIRGQQDFDELVQQMPEALRAMFGMEERVSLSSAPGYFWARFFSSLLTILLVVYAVVAGAGNIGGSEEDGPLELILANPVTRQALAWGRALATALLLALLTLSAGLTFLAMAPPFDALEGIDAGGLLVAYAGCFALALLHGAVAFAGGAIAGRRGPGLGAGLIAAAGGFFAQGLLAAAGAPGWVRALNPWHWYLSSNLLAFGPRWEAVLPALVIAAALTAVSVQVFARRDLR